MPTRVDVGVILPQWSDQATPEGFRRVARAAERCGFDAVWGGDHVVFPESIPDDAADWARIDTPTYDVFTVLSYLAGVTDSIRLGTNIVVAPIRHPVHLVKLAFSMASLTDGRFDLGVAVGWLAGEFDVLDVSFGDRGELTDEFLDLLARARNDGTLAFDGPHHSFDRTGFAPVPDDGDIRTWVGGQASASVRRVAQFGDGWTIGNLTPDELAEQRTRLERAWADFDRTGSPALAHTHDTFVRVGDERPPESYAGSPTVGSPSDVADAIDRYAEAGATQVNLRLRGLSVDGRVEQLHRFADEVVPRL